MSQFFVGPAAGSLPPVVPEMFGVDLDSSGNPPGLVTASNHKIYVDGTNGIVTQAETTDASNDTIRIEYAHGAITTSDGLGQTRTILTFSTSTDSSFTLQAMFAAYEPSTGFAFGGRLLVVCKNNAGTVSIVSEIENVGGGDASLLACSFTAAGSGAFLDFNVSGIAGKTIDWQIITPGVLGAN